MGAIVIIIVIAVIAIIAYFRGYYDGQNMAFISASLEFPEVTPGPPMTMEQIKKDSESNLFYSKDLISHHTTKDLEVWEMETEEDKKERLRITRERQMNRERGQGEYNQ